MFGRIVALLLAALLGLAACSTSLPEEPSAIEVRGGGSTADESGFETTALKADLGSSENSGWIAVDQESAVLLTYQDTDGVLTGTVQASQLTYQQDAWEVQGSSQAFTGRLDATDLSISTELAAPWFGTLDGSVLTLNLPQEDGSLLPVPFRPGSVAEYNAAVSQLSEQANSSNGAAADAEAESAATKKAASTSNSYDAALDRLESSNNSAAEYVESYDFALSGYEAQWENMQKADAALRSAGCIDVSIAGEDVELAHEDVQLAREDLGVVDSDARRATDDIDSALTEARSAFDQASASATSARTERPDRSALDAAAVSSEKTTSSLATTSSAVHQRADEIDTAAKNLAASARGYAGDHACDG